MAASFTVGEKKIRPDVYLRYENIGAPPLAGVDDGKCAAVLRSNWGPINSVAILEKFEDVATVYGNGGTTGVPYEQFRGGARLVYAVRLGTGGTEGTYEIINTAATPEAVLKLSLLYPGSRELTVTIRQTLADPAKSELLILEDTKELERIVFAASDGKDQAAALMAACAAQRSAYFTLKRLSESADPLAAVDQAPITGGTDPVIDVAAYSAAFERLEPYRWNVLAIDTNDIAAHLMMQMYLNRVFQSGKFVQGVIGEDRNVGLKDRLLHASSYNDFQIVYVGHGWEDIQGVTHEGYMAAAYVSGLIAGTPSNETITHVAVDGAVSLTEPLTNNQYEQAITAGMLTFSASAANTVWVESGINTLVLPDTNEDDGWKKIKRVKVRFELFQRVCDTLERLIGRINNDPDGRMTIIQQGNAVCQEMIAEKKLLSGAHLELDKNYAPQGDSAWFLLYADDIDAMEKIYSAFRFRFAPDNAA